MHTKIKLAKWRNGVFAPALIIFDDFCPEYSDEYDCGGNMTKNGVVERLVIGRLHRDFPQAKFFFFTVPNVRYRWVSFYRFETVPENTYLLSKHHGWVDWVNGKIKRNNFYTGFHGWEHCGPEGTRGPAGRRLDHKYSDEFKDRNRKSIIERLGKMMDEFVKAGLVHEKVFVPPAGGVKLPLYEFLADKDIFLAYRYERENNKGQGYPEYAALPGGRRMLCLNRQSSWLPDDTGRGFLPELIDENVEKGRPLVFDNHFCNNDGVRNGINECTVQRLRNVLKYVEDVHGDKVKFLSYGEMRRDVDAINAIRYKIISCPGKTVIKTENSGGELKGISWEVPPGTGRIEILNRDGVIVPFERKRFSNRTVIIVK